MNIQLIDEFRRRTNASYEEAKYYLERFNGDLLEAIVAFEKEKTGHHNQNRINVGASRFLYGLMRIVQKLIDIKLIITDKNFKTFHIPLIILIALGPVWHILCCSNHNADYGVQVHFSGDTRPQYKCGEHC